MNKNLHKIDDIFNTASRQYEDAPSPAVWDKLNAELDKKDTENYKKRYVGWKRVAIILILIMSGFVIYESGLIKTDSGRYQHNDSVKNNLPGENIDQTKNSINGKQYNIKNNAGKIIDGENEQTNPLTDAGKRKIISPKEQEKNNTLLNAEINSQKEYSVNEKTENKRKFKSNQKTLVFLSSQKQPGEKEKNKQNNNLSGADKNIVEAVPSVELIKNEEKRTSPDLETPVFKVFSPQFFADNISVNSPDSIFLKSLVQILPNINRINFKPFWMVSGFASKYWAQYKLDIDEQGNIGNPQNELKEIGDREKHEPSFSAGVFITRQFTRKWGIKTGISFSNTAIVIGPQKLYATNIPDGSVAYKYISSSGYGYVKPGFGLPPSVGDSILSTEAQHNIQSVAIPLMLSYTIRKNNISITPSAGLSANFITKAFITTEITDALNKETENINGLKGMRNFYTGFVADVNLQYNLNNKWSINLLPNFKYAITPVTKGNAVKTFPYSYGLGVGVTLKL